MAAPLFRLRDVAVGASGRAILKLSALDIDGPGLTALVGPMGSGKSTVLRLLAGKPLPGLTAVVAERSHAGARIGPRNLPLFIGQKVREEAPSAAARIAEIDQLVSRSRSALLVDEPTAGLDRDGAEALMERLADLAFTRCVVLVTHNMQEVRAYADRAVLIAGGGVAADMEVESFFAAAPETAAGRFLATGGLALPTPDAPDHDRAPEHRSGPEGFDPETGADAAGRSWLLRNRLGLDPAPGPDAVRLAFDGDRVRLMQGEAGLLDLPWAGGHNRPDLDAPTVLALAREISARLKAGNVVLADPDGNRPATAAVLATLVVLEGGAPDAALQAVALKMPKLHLGMRLEQLIWDLDIQIGLD